MGINSIAEGIKLKIQEKLGIASPEVLDMADKRLEICKPCPSKKTEVGIDFCGECGCVLKLKSLVKESNCKLNKWK